MPDSDWRKFLKDRGGLAAALFAAALFGVIVIQLARSWQWEADYSAARNAENYAADAKNDIAIKCVGLSGQPYDDCADEIDNAAREDQRDEYDLAAQQTSALWTTVMGWMAVVGVGLSGVGVYLIWGTWRQSAEAAENARKTYDAFVAVERARLKVKVAGHGFISGNLVVDIGVTNIGKAPCVVTSFTEAWVASNEFTKIGGYLAQGRHELVGSSETKNVGRSARTDSSRKIVRGFVKYTSPLGEHITHYCFEGGPVSTAPEATHMFRDVKGDDWPPDT